MNFVTMFAVSLFYSSAQASGDFRRLVQPEMGGEGQPCANRLYGECDWWLGLTCHSRFEDGATYGVCARGGSNTGGEGMPCNWLNQCDQGYKPHFVEARVWWKRQDCFCEKLLIVGAPRLGAGLAALQEQVTQGSNVGHWDDSDDIYPWDQAAPKLGRRPDFFGKGGNGQPCRKEYPSCDRGLTCVHNDNGGYETAFCEHDTRPVPTPLPPIGGHEWQPCNPLGNPWGLPLCFDDLTCKDNTCIRMVGSSKPETRRLPGNTPPIGGYERERCTHCPDCPWKCVHGSDPVLGSAPGVGIFNAGGSGLEPSYIHPYCVKYPTICIDGNCPIPFRGIKC